MKKNVLIVSVLLCIGFYQASAQVVPCDPVPGTHYQDHVLNNYVGTWKWTNGTDTFTIELAKRKRDLGDYSFDVLSGGYRFVRNGVEVINTLNDVNIANINAPGGPRASLQSLSRNGNRIFFRFIDRGKLTNRGYKRGRVIAVITPVGNTYSMTWSLVGAGVEVLFPGDTPTPVGWSVPTDVVLIRQ